VSTLAPVVLTEMAAVLAFVPLTQSAFWDPGFTLIVARRWAIRPHAAVPARMSARWFRVAQTRGPRGGPNTHPCGCRCD